MVDYKANTWRYSLAATNPDEDTAAWEGDAKTKSLIFIPFSAYTQKVSCPFCEALPTEATKEAELAIALSGNEANLELTTEAGERMGQYGEEYVNEVDKGELTRIKDTMYSDRAPYLKLPMTVNFDLAVVTRPDVPLARANLRMTGPGFAFAILGMSVKQGQRDILSVSPSTQEIEYTPSGNNRRNGGNNGGNGGGNNNNNNNNGGNGGNNSNGGNDGGNDGNNSNGGNGSDGSDSSDNGGNNNGGNGSNIINSNKMSSNNSNNVIFSPVIQVANTVDGQGTAVSVVARNMPVGSEVSLQLDPVTGNTMIGSTAGGEFGIIVVQTGPDGDTVYANDNVPVPSGGALNLATGDDSWNGIASLPMSVDPTGSGNFQPAPALSNEIIRNLIVTPTSVNDQINLFRISAAYLTSEQIDEVINGLAQTNLSGQEIGQVLAGLNLRPTLQQLASLISLLNFSPEEIANLLRQLHLPSEAIDEILAGAGLSPDEQAILDQQLVHNNMLDDIIRNIDFDNFDNAQELADYLADQNLSQADLDYIIIGLDLSPIDEAIIRDQIIPQPISTPNFTASPDSTATPNSSTTPNITSTPGGNRGDNPGGSGQATPTKPVATATANNPGATSTPQPTSTPLASATTKPTATSETPTATATNTTPTPTETSAAPTATATLGPPIIVDVGQPSDGVLTLINGNTGLLYRPNAKFYGTDSFTYTVKPPPTQRRSGRQTAALTPTLSITTEQDTPNVNITVLRNSQPQTMTVEVTMTVLNLPDEPQAVTDSFTILEDTPTWLNLLANDSYLPDPPEVLTITSITLPLSGTAQIINCQLALCGVVAPQAVIYTPSLEYSGPDMFTYTLLDENGGVATASVTLTVIAVNDPPVAMTDSFVITENTPMAFNLLANDSTVEPNEILQITTVTSPTHGQANRITADTVIYTPLSNYNGLDSFSYTLDDGNGSQAVGIVMVTVNPVNDAPVNTLPLAITVPINNPFTFSVASGYPIMVTDSDVADLPLEVSLALNGNNAITPGTLTLTDTTGLNFSMGDGLADAQMSFSGTFTAVNHALSGVIYQPSPNYTGTVSLQMTSNDLGHSGVGGALTDVDQCNIVVISSNIAPLITSQPPMTSVQNTVGHFTYDITLNDLNPQDTLIASAVMTLPTWLTLVNHGNRTAILTGTPTITQVGLHLVELQVSDGQLTASQSFTITVFNTAPMFLTTPVLTATQH